MLLTSDNRRFGASAARSQAARRGIVAPLVAICLVALLGICALVLDLGFMQDRKRHLQGAADAAARAAAIDFFVNFINAPTSPSPMDPGNISATNSAVEVAKRNGYQDGVNNTSVVVNAPPNSGPFKNTVGYCEVIITYSEPRRFSAIFGSGSLPITARAVARGGYSAFRDGILVLDPTVKAAGTLGGSQAVMILKNAPLVINSNNPDALDVNGGSSIRSEKGYYITGTNGSVSNNLNALDNLNGVFDASLVHAGSPPTPDPFANLPQPADPSGNPMAGLNLPTNPSVSKVQVGSNKTYTYSPGIYTQSISITGQDNVVLKPGIYIFQKGFNFNSSGYLQAYDVMAYDSGTGSADSFSITGSAGAATVPGTSNQVIWSPFGIAYTDNNGVNHTTSQALTWTDGAGNGYTSPMFAQYGGFSVWVNRNNPGGSGNTMGAPVNIVGNGTFIIGGLFYTPNSAMKVAGNGDSQIGAQYISRTLTVQGNGTYTVDYIPSQLPKIRVIDLVE